MSHVRTDLTTPRFFAEGTTPEMNPDTDTCVVFVHGLGGNSMVHHPLQEAVAGIHATVAIDLIGLGRSRHSVPESMETWVDQIQEAVAAAGRFQHLILVGHSLGTLIARDVAARDARVDALVLFGPITAPSDEQRPIFTSRGQAALTDGMPAVADNFGVASLAAHTLAGKPLSVALVREFLLGQDPTSYAACCAVIGDATEPGAPMAQACRALLVRGSDDRISSHELVFAVEHGLRPAQTRTVVLDGVGHWPQIESVDVCTQLLLEHVHSTHPLAHSGH